MSLGSKNHKTKRTPIILAVLFALIFISCGNIPTATDEIIGMWKASDIRYNNTSFEIKRKEISFVTKEGDVNCFTITKVKKEPMENKEWVQYTIYYNDRDLQKVEFPFYFNPSGSGIIRFKNQPSLVWKKDIDIKT